ncbi:MAG: primosomal protein N' [Bacteroidales bacterium]|nr:primosomal protein N' [Bacteroidales bacterium]
MNTFVDVILPLPLQGVFTYRVPSPLSDAVQIGIRVLVNFGRNKFYAGVIARIHHEKPEHYIVKDVVSVLDEQPLLTAGQLEFWQWVSSYYMCTIGEVMVAALPGVFRLSSETKIALHPDFNGDISGLNAQELAVVDVLAKQKILSFKDVYAVLGNNYAMQQVRNMIDKSLLVLCEEVTDKYKPKQEIFIGLADHYQQHQEELAELMSAMEQNKKTQLQADTLIQLMMCIRRTKQDMIKKSELLSLAGVSENRLNALIKKGVLKKENLTVSRWQYQAHQKPVESILLSPEQEQAYNDIRQQLKSNNKLLLHGVTGSGKTEIYIKLIHDYLQQGKQVLYLLPEIALTEHIISRLRAYFGDMVGIYHSHYNYMQRAEVWQEMNHPAGRFKLILGTRSALFMPFSNLGLIVVDEEHDMSYKQFEPAPRYQARDAAIMLASQVHADIILGTATPSMETYFNVLRGKYGYVKLTKRYGGAQLPQIELINMREAATNRQLQGHFSNRLVNDIEQALELHQQVILFQNRRGYSPYMECPACGYIPHCQYCDVTLTYHKGIRELQCHYCGYSVPLQNTCPECGQAVMQMKGFGTEMIEEELQTLFPQAHISRLDYDVTRKKDSHKQILADFGNGLIDILIGTQMVTKGLDFDNVSLVGILNADNMLNYPDFRSYERALQLMMQVSGRAGRKNKQGKVLIQTHDIKQKIFSYILNNDYDGAAAALLEERKKFVYPPYVRLIKVGIQHKDEKKSSEAALCLAQELRKILDIPVLGPETALVSKVKNVFRKEIIIKTPMDKKGAWRKQKISDIIGTIKADRKYTQVMFVLDVDMY